MTQTDQHRVSDPTTGLEYTSTRVEVDGTEYGVIEVRPTKPLVLGRDRLDQIRAGDSNSQVDRSMLEICSSWDPPADAVVFIANPGEGRSWGYADDLSHAEGEELGRAMVEGQLALYRGLVHAGIYSLTGIALQDREYEAFSRGTEEVADRIERRLPDASEEEATIMRLDLWLLDHLALWTTLSRDRFFAGRLPETLSLIARRRRQLDMMNTDILESGVYKIPG